jgi:hypothetical protein
MRRWNVLILAGTLSYAGPSLASPGASRGRPARSEVCSECHRDIYRMWRTSAHARAMEDPIFLDAYRETNRREGESVGRICTGCHGPAADLLKDADLDLKVSWEGVSCDICHGISSVEVTELGPKLTYDIGKVKRGPIKDAESMAHEVQYSELHTTAAVCAPCHEYRNPEGTVIMATYSEWQQSPASKDGRSCQTCHMNRTEAEVVDARVARVPDAEVNLHDVPGGHSITQLNKALAVTFNPKRSEGHLVLDVGLKNVGAGHAVPTGMPSRRVVLEIKVKTSDGQTYNEQRTYGQTFEDATGAPIITDSGYFAKGVKRTADTRILGGESRTETFRFPVFRQSTAFVSVRLSYEHAPTGDKENRTWITFYTTERTVGPETPPGR